MTFHSLRFDRAASTYGAHARIQERMADILIGLVPVAYGEERGPMPSASGPAVLEMGCGTGIFTRRLAARFPGAGLIATDAAPRMLAESAKDPVLASAGARWLRFEASGQEPSIPNAVRGQGPFALAASNALVQWFPDLASHFALVSSLLLPEGTYLVSGFSRDNFPELNAILREPPFAYGEYPGQGEKEVGSAAAAAGWEMEAFLSEDAETVVPTPEAFLESVRGLGSARRPDQARPLTRSRLRLLLERYREGYACAGGVKVTWKPWYARLRKRH